MIQTTGIGQKIEDRKQRTEDKGQRTEDRGPRLGDMVFWFFVIAIVSLPLFAHGCHSEDVDNEPGMMPRNEAPDRGLER